MSDFTQDINLHCNNTDYLKTQCYFNGLPCGDDDLYSQMTPSDVNSTVLTAFQCGMKECGYDNSSYIDVSDLQLHCNGSQCFYTGIPCEGLFYNQLAPGDLNYTVEMAYYCGKRTGESRSGAISLHATKGMRGMLVMLLLFSSIFFS